MNSIRRYYTDSYTVRFDAKIVERVEENGRIALILDQTYFYPASGGQPHDRGKLSSATVTNVTIREADGAVLHWVNNDDEIWFDGVKGEIDWTRRFDHMQQHSGQHILSQAFIQVAEAETASFHLSDNSITIDLEVDNLPQEQINRAEFLANQIIWQNRPIHVREVTVEQAQKLPVRKIPPNQSGKLRLIEIDKFDLTACGGTHVAATGAVGTIKIIKTERHRGKFRVEFCCGQRALLDYRHKNQIVTDLANQLTTGTAELLTNVQKLQEENKTARRTIKQQQDALLAFRAESLLISGTAKKKITVISRVFDDEDMDAGQLRTLANLVLEKSKQTVILLGIAGSKTNFLFSRSEDAPGDMNELLKITLQVLGSASGGGTAVTAQGGGTASDKERVEQAIARAEKQLWGQIR
jgi:alanyl-tRNA synthetase